MIAAVLRVDGVDVEPALLDRMLGVWRPVAVDAEGTWVRGQIGLGEDRLCLTEELSMGLLPVRDAPRELVLAWDGRLDNREDLLTSLGSRRPTRAMTDDELVLNAYARWGTAFVERLLGDFAFILWDGRARRLTAGRDRIGLRPLHYAFNGRSLVVASRIGQVLEGARLARRLNEPMVADFLADNLSNPDETLLRDVWRVPAAHLLEHAWNAHAPRVFRYWELHSGAPIRYCSNGEYAEHFREIADKAVGSCLRGPHRAGVMLSGGHDSSTVACIASELIDGPQPSNGRLATFTTVFDHRPEEDERRFVEALIALHGFESHYVISDEMWTFKDHMPRAGVWDEPFEGPFDGLIAGLVECAQQRGVRVLLDGVGGDTLFGGSPYHLFDLFLDRRWGTLSRELRCWPLAEWSRLIRSYVLAPLVRKCPPHRAPAVPEWMSPHFAARCETERRLQAIYPPHRFRRPTQQETYAEVTHTAFPNRMLWLQSLALARGIDLRHPILDLRMIDFFMRIPSSQTAENRSDKVFIRRAMRNSFPPIITDRHLDLGEYIEPVLKRGLLERWGKCFGGRCHVVELGYVDPALLRASFLRYVERECDNPHARKLALVLRLEQWLRYLFGEPS